MRETQGTVLRPATRLAAKIKAATFEAGLICYPMSGTIMAAAATTWLLAPPTSFFRKGRRTGWKKLAIGIPGGTGV